MYIAVSGNLASGKTTVARGLAKAFNCTFYPRQSYNRSYIEDLYREPLRWTAEAQISFMVHKHDEVRHGLDQGRLFVLDRSFDEEVEVFAERFHEEGKIEERSMGLIRQIAADLRLRLEQPSLIVFCDCPAAVCEERLEVRPRPYQNSYPPDHLARLEGTISAWLNRQTVPVLHVDTTALDFRVEANALELARRIDAILTRTRTDQLDLFATDSGRSDAATRRQFPSLLRKRQVYLAAPFTARATLRVAGDDADAVLFQEAGQGEDIPTAYRRRLGALARAIESHGHDVVLPHRDINRWGRRSLAASEVASRCLAAVASADCFVGLIAESFGSHAELAYALALGKPSMVLISEREPTSFFGLGMAAMSRVAVVRGRSVGALATALRQTDPLAKMTWRQQ